MDSCLTDTDLHRYHAGEISVSEEASVRQHLAECDECARRDAELVAEHDELVRRAKRAAARRADDRLFHDIRQAYGAETTDNSKPTLSCSGESASPSLPASIEGYDILSEIHRGGQGVVYKAVQKATKRIVALKVLLEGPYASPRQRMRFEREIELVAGLQHPHIVTVYDSGVTRDGRHFFAMEYVHGRPLSNYLKEETLSMEETLRLFSQICRAVSYAHQRGVIHRDLKPGNISIDADGEPHILDFGLAKAALREVVGEDGPVTVTGEFMGTLAYASPEQTKGDPHLVDSRTDVYSLGVVLYEMLTGKLPYPVVGAMADVLRSIAQDEPTKPSTVRKEITDEVETIVLRALAKEKERRYQSAAAMAEDVERCLAGEPIQAKQDSRFYMLKKALSHYRRAALIGSVMAAVLAFAVGVGLHYWLVAKRQSEATQLVSEALPWIAQRSRLPYAQQLLDRAIGICPDHAHAYLQRGLLSAIQGLEAKLEDKEFHLEQAVDYCYRAHLAAGGAPLGHATSPEPPGSRQTGLRSALLLAGTLLHLADRAEEAAPYFALVNVAGSGDTSWHTQVYDLYKDPQVASAASISSSPDAAHMEPNRNATIRWGHKDEVRSLNPLTMIGRDRDLVELLFDRLCFQVVEDGAPAARVNPTLVKDLTRQSDQLTWDITLQPGLSWHDGHPLTAEDVAFSWQLRNSDVGTVQSVDAVGIDRVQVVFKRVTATMDHELLFPLIPKHLYETSGDEFDDRFAQRPIGNGPYRWSPQSTADVVVLERWEEYPGPAPYLRQIEFHIMPDRARRIQALADGRIDVTELTGLEFCWPVNGESFRGHTSKIRAARWAFEYICWNSDGSNPFFQDSRVRRAMTQALNIGSIISGRFGDLYSPCSGIYGEGSWMSNPDVAPLEYRPEQARVLLDAAGWSLDNSRDGIRSRGGRRFEFTLLIPEISYDFRSIAFDLQQDLRAVGVSMLVETTPWQECFERMQGHDFEAYAGHLLTSGHPDRGTVRWTTDGSMNYGGYSNPKVDELYELARQTADRARRRAYYQQIQRLIYDDQPFTFLWNRPTMLAVNSRLRGVQISPLGITGCGPGPRSWWLPAE